MRTEARRSPPVVDRDEYGREIADPLRLRLGAGSESADDVGLFVRFEPGFGLNVHIGRRWRSDRRVTESDLVVLGIDGWETLCALVDEHRERQRGAR